MKYWRTEVERVFCFIYLGSGCPFALEEKVWLSYFKTEGGRKRKVEENPCMSVIQKWIK